MRPKDIARWLTDDPDVLEEWSGEGGPYCSACGGWDREQGGRGHSLGCPIGKEGSPIAKSKMIPTNQSGLWVCSGRVHIGDLEPFYFSAKEDDGVIVSYHACANRQIYVSVMFSDYNSAETFQQNNYQFNGPLDPAEMVPPEEANELISRFSSGAVDRMFVKSYDLS